MIDLKGQITKTERDVSLCWFTLRWLGKGKLQSGTRDCSRVSRIGGRGLSTQAASAASLGTLAGSSIGSRTTGSLDRVPMVSQHWRCWLTSLRHKANHQAPLGTLEICIL